MWKKLVVVWAIIMVLSCAVLIEEEKILISGGNDIMDWLDISNP